MSKKIQDTIGFSIEAETTVNNTTVKFTTSVIAVIDGVDITEDNLSSSVRELLNNFIPGEWTFSNPTRNRNDAGFEEARFVASLRTDQAENHNLAARQEAVSRRGLRITKVTTDTSTPKRAIAEAESALRVILLKRAANQAKDLSEAAGRNYRVHAINFDQMRPDSNAYNLTAAATAYRLDASANGLSDAIGHAQKLSMSANVILATSEGID